jgi:saccharopine dehydrogenase (NADP+, L-glutamate forming)
MRKIVLIGAGRSSSCLIRYLLEHSEKENWTLIVADVSEHFALQKTGGHPRSRAIKFDINDEVNRTSIISEADVVISMLPAHMHLPVAIECLKQKKHLLTASYVSPEMQALNNAAELSGVLFLNECGLDPGLDHMSAMKIIDEIKSEGGEFDSFKSYTGGLVAPESNDNPWGYKFSWNPRNVILAGQGTARFIEKGNYKYVPYNRLFKSATPVYIDGVEYGGYANRDSLSYRKHYGLENIPTMIRGTLRYGGYCSAWDIFIQLGLTDDTFTIEDSAHLTYKQLVEAFIPSYIRGTDVAARLAAFTGYGVESNEMKMFEWTGMLSDEVIGLNAATPAQIIQHLLELKWKLKPEDIDLIVMQHLFDYKIGDKNFHLSSSLCIKGEDGTYTAMAKTVGLPMAIATRLLLAGKINLTGVKIPVQKQIYLPVLEELASLGIKFNEKVMQPV